MNLLNRPGRQRNVVSPLPAYLQPLCVHGPVRFDPTLETAREIMQTRHVVNDAVAGGNAEQLEGMHRQRTPAEAILGGLPELFQAVACFGLGGSPCRQLLPSRSCARMVTKASSSRRTEATWLLYA